MLRSLTRLALGRRNPDRMRSAAGCRSLLTRRLIIEGLEQRELFAQLTWAVGPALPEARAGAAAVSSGGSLLLIGGGTTTVNSWNSSNSTWVQATPIDMPRVSAGAANIAGGYLVYGGENAGALLEETLSYNPWNIDNTQDTTVMPTPSSDFAYATDDNLLAYAIGGRSDQATALNRVVRFSSATQSWQTVAAMPIALTGASAVNDGQGHLLVFGGLDANGNSSNQLLQYTVATDTWTNLTTMPVAEHHGAAVLASNGRIYVTGGANDVAPIATVQAYDPVAHTWTIETSLPQPLSHVAAASDSDGHIVVMGGYDVNHQPVKLVSVSQVLNTPDVAPAFTSTAPTSVMVGSAYAYNLRTTGNPQATYRLVTAPAGMTVDAVGTIAWTPTLAQAGVNTITVRATNVVGSADQTFSVRALTPAPTAPSNLAVSSVTTTSATVTWSPSTDSVGIASYRVYRMTHTGFRGITTTYTQIAEVASTTAIITGLTAGSSYVYIVKAVNPSGNVSPASNSVTARTLSPIAYTGPTTVSGVARHPISFTLSAVANPNTFSYTNLTPTDGMTLDAATGLVTWTPADSDLGANYFTYRIAHPLGAVTVEVTINVTPNVPYSTFIAGPSAVVGIPYTAQFSQIADPYNNTDPVTFSLVSAPAGMTIDSTTGQIRWTPTSADLAANATVSVSISNYAGSTTNTASIAVAFASAVQLVTISHVSTTTATVSWTPPTDVSQDITGYLVTASYRVQSGRAMTTRTLGFSASAADRSLLMSGLPAGKAIAVYVRAIDASNHNSWPGTASFTTATQLPNVTISGGPFYYDGTAHSATAVATASNGLVVPGTFTFTYNGLDTAPTLPGDYTVRALFTSNDPYYGERIATAVIAILPGIPRVNVASSLVSYDSQSHAVSATAIGIDDVAVNGSFSFTYNGSATPPTLPGQYDVVASFSSGNPLYGASTGTGQLTIRSVGNLAPRLALTRLSTTYDGTPHAVVATATNASGAPIAGRFLITYNGGADVPTNFGVYNVVATFISSDPNYHDDQITGRATIHKADPSADIGWLSYIGSAPTPVITYDGSSHEATAIAIGVNGEVVPGSFTFDYSPTAPTNSGTYSVTANFASSDINYANKTFTQNLTIDATTPYIDVIFRSPASQTASNYFYGVYDGLAWTAQATAFDLSGNPLLGSIQYTYFAYDTNTLDFTIPLPSAPTQAGTYMVMASLTSGSSNYADTVGYGLIQVDSAVPQLSIGGTYNYDGLGHAASIRAVGVDGVASVVGTLSILYNGSTTLPVNAGTYGVSVSFISSDPNYQNAAGDGTLVINKVTPVFSNLSVPTVVVGTSSTTASGRLAAGSVYPSGSQVSITIGANTITTRVSNTGTFSVAIPTATLAIGSYPVRFAFAGNSAGFNAATAATATLVVTVRVPAITLNPVATTVNAGATTSFTAAASGDPVPTIQWQQSSDSGATYTSIAGATSTTLNVVTTNTMNGYRYRAVFTNSGGTATTSAAILTVQYAPVVTTNPVSQTVTVGTTARFTAAARANPTATVQWQVSSNGGTTWSNIAGATSTTYSVTATTSLRGYRYRAIFTNSLGSAATTAATLTV